jgi:hypothetical protein
MPGGHLGRAGLDGTMDPRPGDSPALRLRPDLHVGEPGERLAAKKLPRMYGTARFTLAGTGAKSG